LMGELRLLDDASTARRRPSLFDVDAPDEFADEAGTLRYLQPQYRLSANSAYNTRVSFHAPPRKEDFPRVALNGGSAGAFVLRGRGVELVVARGGSGERTVVLTGDASGLRVSSDVNPTAPVLDLRLRVARTGQAALRNYRLLRAAATANGLVVRAEELDLQLRVGGGVTARRLSRGVDQSVQAADIVELPGALAENLWPSFAVEESAHGTLVGPAWVRGAYRLAYDPDPLLPWTRHLATALLSPSTARTDGAPPFSGTLTIDHALQSAAQQFAATRGRLRHGQLLAARGAREALPPRVALAAVSLPSGQVLAMGGWPRVQSGQDWQTSDTGAIPSAVWAEERAPKPLRRRYGGDRNFDRMLMGSATKPIFASAILAAHGDLDRRLAVRGASGEENTVFGIDLHGPAWDVGSSASLDGTSPWSDFTSYLARSDNRYHIRLGFAGLAEPDAADGVQAVPGVLSPSAQESMDLGRTEWRRYPLFPSRIEFDHRQRGRLRDLAETPLAERLAAMYGIGIRGNDRLPRYSFWTGNEADDQPAPAGAPRPSLVPLSAISPEPPQFGLHRIETARTYVSLLLGGDENMWANIDFAAAFGTTVSGRPVVPHVLSNAHPVTTRAEFPEIAARLRPGLEAVVSHEHGTAHGAMRASGALNWLTELRAAGYRIYAKTGTLAQGQGQPATSRLVLAIVRWNQSGDAAERGIVFSLVIERGQVGLAASWLGEFLVQQAGSIRRLLDSQVTVPPGQPGAAPVQGPAQATTTH
jgi:hypothetical protein